MGWSGSRLICLWIAIGWPWSLSVPLLMCCTRRRRQCLRNCPGRKSWEMLLLLAKLAAMVTVFQGSGPHYTEWLGRYKKLQLSFCVFTGYFFKATHYLPVRGWGDNGKKKNSEGTGRSLLHAELQGVQDWSSAFSLNKLVRAAPMATYSGASLKLGSLWGHSEGSWCTQCGDDLLVTGTAHRFTPNCWWCSLDKCWLDICATFLTANWDLKVCFSVNYDQVLTWDHNWLLDIR